MVKHAVRSVLVVAASLLFACGGGDRAVEPTSTVQATASKSLAISMSLAPTFQCSDLATIAAGWRHTVGLKEDGTVVAAGYNGDGELNVSPWMNIKAIAAGWYHTVGLKMDGTVVTAGYSSYGLSDVSSFTKIKAIAAGWHHTVGLREDGTVVAIGDITSMDVSAWKNIKAVAAGYAHTVGLKEDGTVVAVGNNGAGRLNVSSWTNIKAIAAGAYHTVGLKEDGTVVAVGDIASMDVSSWTNIKAIAAGASHTVGLKEDGTVVAVGSNDNNQLDVSSWTNIKAIAAGYAHTVGLKEDGTVVAVGSTKSGVLEASTWTNIMPLCMPASPISQDVTPPSTISMVMGALGNNGWYVSDVQITLTATDNDGGSGVKEIHYTVDGSETVVPGSLASLSVSDGIHTVSWYAIDNAGNAETAEEITINIDNLAPTITGLGTNSAILWPPNHKMVNIAIGGSVADTGSGIASAIITVTDEYGIYNGTFSGLGSVIPLEAWRKGSDTDGRVYTITAVVTDNAGNQSTGTTTVVVPHDMGKGSGKDRDDDECARGDEHGHQHHHHRSGHDRDDHDGGHRHNADRDAKHEGGRS